MDNFIQENINDFWLPFNEQTLPRFINEAEGINLRQAFFSVQDYYLTAAKDIETGLSNHLILRISGDVYFVPEKPLGHGSFGGVDLVFSRLSTASYARKRVLRARGSEKAQDFIIRELQELRALKHQHLVEIVGSYTDNEFIAYLMRPVAEGTLEQFLGGGSRNADYEDVLRQSYGCLAGAVNYLHENCIRHRDLTARNILIHRGEVYISDFGSAYNWTHEAQSMTRHRSPPVSPDYMAPEIAKDEERGSPSDMWSLGIVFLEMTTKLLGRRVAELKGSIKRNANKTNSRPFAYANIPVVIEWMETLVNGETAFDHDREPLGWIRELLHEKPNNRLTSRQLMKHILESPSFGIFCCFKCQPAYQAGTFAYGQSTMRSDTREESKETRDQVGAMFDGSTSHTPFTGASTERTDSIEKWLTDSTVPAFEIPAADVPPLYNNHELERGGLDPGQIMYRAYEHEFYRSPIADAQPTETLACDTRRFPQFSELVELPGDMAWYQGDAVDAVSESGHGFNERRYRDSGFGFLEYDSGSSENGKFSQAFHEISDRSEVDSENASIAELNGIIGCIFDGDESSKLCQNGEMEDSDSVGGMDTRRRAEPILDEISDKSEDEAPFDEMCDQSDSNEEVSTCSHAQHQDGRDMSEAEKIGIEAPDMSATHATEPQHEADRRPSTFHVSEDGTVYTGTMQSQVEERWGSPIDQVETAQDPVSHLRPKVKKKVRIQDDMPHPSDSAQHVNVPEIVVESTDNNEQGQPQLSEATVRSFNEENQTQKEPRSPRKRAALLGVNANKLMMETWDMASSVPTSRMSERTNSTISKLLLMMLSEAEFVQILTSYCKKGEASAVRTLLQKRFTSTMKRICWSPLYAAIKGASKRHTKCVRELIAAGVDVNIKHRGRTPLHVAIEHSNFKGYVNLIWLLLSADADPNLKDRNGDYPLMKLFFSNESTPLPQHRRGALAILLQSGAEPNLRLPGTSNTPLHLAVRCQDKWAVAMLLHMGADVNARTSSGTTPLQITANQFHGGELTQDHAEVLDHLLQHGARVDEKAGALGRSALHWAVVASCAHAVEMLLRYGASATLLDSEGNSAVALAIKGAERLTRDPGRLDDHVEIMERLDKAAECKWPMGDGKCALEVALRRDDTGLLKALIKEGLRAKTKYGQTSIKALAKEIGNTEAVELLAQL